MLASLALVWDDYHLGRPAAAAAHWAGLLLGWHAVPAPTRHLLFRYYLWKSLSKPYHQLSFTSLFVFSFLTLDKTCRRSEAGFADHRARTREKTPRVTFLGPRKTVSLEVSRASVPFRNQVPWGFCFCSRDGHLPTV